MDQVRGQWEREVKCVWSSSKRRSDLISKVLNACLCGGQDGVCTGRSKSDQVGGGASFCVAVHAVWWSACDLRSNFKNYLLSRFSLNIGTTILFLYG